MTAAQAKTTVDTFRRRICVFLLDYVIGLPFYEMVHPKHFNCVRDPLQRSPSAAVARGVIPPHAHINPIRHQSCVAVGKRDINAPAMKT